MTSELKDLLLQSLQSDYKGFTSRFRQLPYAWSDSSMNIAGHFYYLAFRDGHPTVEDFTNFIYGNITQFCIPRDRRDDAHKQFAETGEWRYVTDVHDQARSLFVKAKNSQKTSGEPGELILFILLEAALGAPQLACKMYLKTSEEMNVHGSDSIHVTVGSDTNTLRLIWGESKVYQELSTALTEICDSIKKFEGAATGRTPKNRDIDIVRNHLSIKDDVVKELVLRYFDPYDELSNNREEAYACFAGFDYSGYEQLTSDSPVEDQFQALYTERVKSACKLFKEKLEQSSLTNLRLYFFLIPFPCVATLRTRFFSLLGAADA